MRIGYCLYSKDSLPSGVERYALGALRSVSLCAPGDDYVVFLGPRGATADGACGPGVQFHPAGYATRWGRALWEQVVLPRRARRERLDVLHCPSYVGPARGADVPVVVTVHDTIALDHPQWCTRLNAAHFRALLKRSCRAATRVVAVSTDTARRVAAHCDLPGEKVVVIPPGVDECFFRPVPPGRRREARHRLALPERYILFVGNIEPKKNLATLLEAHDRLRRGGYPHSLVLAGGRTWRQRSVLRQVRRLRGVIRLGYVAREDLPAVYALADVHVAPSRHEGFAFTPLEAMACGTPVVCSPRGALDETVADAAETVDPDSPADVAGGIARVLDSESLRRRLREAGRRRARAFSWADCGRRLHALYQELSG